MWPLKDCLEILNGNSLGEGDSFVKAFEKKLPFSLFYKFLKKNKQYIYNKAIPQYSCLCETCENTCLMARGLSTTCKTKKIPTSVHELVEEYSCSEAESCMHGNCDDCSTHGLGENDFQSEDSSDDAADDICINFHQWKKNDQGYLAKMMVSYQLDDALELWQQKIARLKQHIFIKRIQFAEIQKLEENSTENQLLIHLNQQQNEIQSAYFGNKSFSLFTTCSYYRSTDGEIEKIPITVTSEESDKLRISSISNVSKVITHSIEISHQNITTVFIASDGMSSQFRSRFIFHLLNLIHQSISLEWYYNEASHGKGPMDGIGGTVKNTVYRRVMSGDIVINHAKEFATFANDITKVESLYLLSDEVMKEPEEVKNAKKIPNTLQIHKVVREKSNQGVFCNKFFFLSSDKDPLYTQWYGEAYGHEVKNQDENTCCLAKYKINENWLKCFTKTVFMFR